MNIFFKNIRMFSSKHADVLIHPCRHKKNHPKVARFRFFFTFVAHFKTTKKMRLFLLIWLGIVAFTYLVMLCDVIYYNRKARLLWKSFVQNIVEEED